MQSQIKSSVRKHPAPEPGRNALRKSGRKRNKSLKKPQNPQEFNTRTNKTTFHIDWDTNKAKIIAVVIAISSRVGAAAQALCLTSPLPVRGPIGLVPHCAKKMTQEMLNRVGRPPSNVVVPSVNSLGRRAPVMHTSSEIKSEGKPNTSGSGAAHHWPRARNRPQSSRY